MVPGFARIGGFINSIAHREIRPLHTLAAAYVDDVRIRRSEGDCADRAGRLVIEQRMPCSPNIIGLPNSAIRGGNVEYIRLGGDAGSGDGASSAKRPNHPPAQPGKISLGSQRYYAEKQVSESMHGNRV